MGPEFLDPWVYFWLPIRGLFWLHVLVASGARHYYSLWVFFGFAVPRVFVLGSFPVGSPWASCYGARGLLVIIELFWIFLFNLFVADFLQLIILW